MDQTREDGFNGIAAIIWVVVFLRSMQFRSNGGEHFLGMQVK